ncbi:MULTISPECIES: M48 family metalloprotease [Marinobacter]|jgi:beta-barrel assembly-enhancing protease|uniref:M48 family metalloprotease n=1 Tax=Marinobacter TaxID=2742 RepID=UPI000948E8A2|nr:MULTISPECIES: M48 family metalloprotease [Marinobacter]MDC8455721.1 M48 family metallopeptidase [Marinobacter sp. DS40M6]MDM8181945.1 M48 family metalloprotease [Marinobacter salarius]MDP4532440.1 M48 family metalloprotease [Marinobacter salarius]OLF82719.1 peptidase M48 [Marinobacter sp. C18]RUT74944.1 M48 family peptidase [Marinobacter sp. NP-6]|tara:strand:+ start:4981 stop:6459 length:1479 start_codon:yes stop_codon:yes gene_type:complete
MTVTNRHRAQRPGILASAFALAFSLTVSQASAQSSDSTLPSIGGAGGGLISERQETDIGRQVMTSIRRSAPQITDALVQDYLNSIIYRLVPSAPLSSSDLTLAIIDSPDINAFAVPGNVVGVNGGLFLNAESEQQFASVLAHELAHLSQRHFARRLEQQETSAPLTIAGMIAGIILSAVTQSDVGIAAIAGTQALAVQNMLAYSRAHEQEADRVGMDILASSGMDPRGMPEMFEIMMRQNRLQGNRVPEYLSTHPLTQNRVSDTRNRAEQYPRRDVADAQEYHLVRSRLQVRYAKSADIAVETFKDYLNRSDTEKPDAIRYGLAVALLRNGNQSEAIIELERLLDGTPGRITYQVTLAEALIEQDKLNEARSLLSEALARNPGNYPITDMLAHLETAAGNGERAAEYLHRLTRELPKKEHLWLRLAEAEGLARNIVGVHRARAEYDILMGDLEAAQRQLRQAQERLPAGAPLRQIVTERLSQVSERLNQRRS